MTEILVAPRPVECVLRFRSLRQLFNILLCVNIQEIIWIAVDDACYKDSRCSLLCVSFDWLFWIADAALFWLRFSTNCAALDHHLSIDDGRSDGNRCSEEGEGEWHLNI